MATEVVSEEAEVEGMALESIEMALEVEIGEISVHSYAKLVKKVYNCDQN